MMKKFINSQETITDEELEGFGLAYGDIVAVDGHTVVSRALEDADRVTIVTYGGSGHEPAQKGFVGAGMLDIQVDGDIFAAPNGAAVFEAMKLADKGHGVLLLTLNYAGDQLAGKQAMKLAKKAGMNVRQVVTGEEIQYNDECEDNQHGEGGGVRVPMASSADTVALIAPKLVEHVGLAAGDKAFVMINGCGATTMMEMLVLYKDAVRYLEGLGIEVVANMVGEILTVQESGGFQMNIAKWDDEFVRLWNTPAHTPVFFKE